ncbi:MAG TPA: hypothetical protein PK566_06940 [Pseudobacteroides sp.]|nr:hypothetical protein [Pseudobacteroides sp.]
MSEGKFHGGLFNNDEILWFIILFLLIFYCRPKWGRSADNPVVESC